MANKYLDKQGLERVKRDLDIQLGDYGKTLSVSINSSTYVMTFQLKNGNNVLSEQTVDLPLESVVVGGSYDSDNEKIVLTLQNGETIEIPVSDLVSGLVSQSDLTTALASYYTSSETNTLLGGKQDTIDSTHKLSADLVDDTDTTNKFVTSSDKTTWNGKQDALTTSLDTETLSYYVGFDSNGKLSKGSPQSITIATEVQENNNNAVSSDAVFDYAYPKTNPNGFISGINGTMVETALGFTPYNASNPSGYQANVIESISINGTAQTITSKNVDLPAYPTKTSLGLDNVVNVGMDNVPTQYSDNGVKSGGVYSAIQDVAEIANGKTRNYVISDSALTGYVNDSFNSTNDTITLTISGNKIKDIENNDIQLSAFKVGDIVSITETNVPDRWVGSISGGNIVFYKLETKIDVASSVQSGNANPVSSAGVFNYVGTANATYRKTAGANNIDNTFNANATSDKTINIDDLQARYHLGAYDTVDTSNADYDTVYINTRKDCLADFQCWQVSGYTHIFRMLIPKMSSNTSSVVSNKYVRTGEEIANMPNKSMRPQWYINQHDIIIRDDDYSDVASFVASLQYVYLEYLLDSQFRYSYQVIKNQPLNTLDQNGSQWVRNEYEKTLNLFGGSGVSTSGGTFSNGVFTKTLGSNTLTHYYVMVDSSIIVNHSNVQGYYADTITITSTSQVLTLGLIGNVSDSYCNITGLEPGNYTISSIFAIGSSTASLSNIMLNEGSVALPYQPYSGEIVHKGDIEPVLLWENSSPNSAFTSTGSSNTISLPTLSTYKYIVIEYRVDTSSSVYYATKEYKYAVKEGYGSIDYISNDVNELYVVSRIFYLTINSIYFRDAFTNTARITNPVYGQTNNNGCVPIKIYGTNIL